MKLIDSLRDEEDDTPCLVFEKLNMRDLIDIKDSFTPEDVKLYMYKIFMGINYAHSKGIMHRDIKMHNILVDNESKELKIIDWGLSEYYHWNFPYNLKVSTKFYRAPELILGYQYYDYSLDIWWIAILFAELLANKFPLINCIDSKDQLYKLIKILGYKEFKDFITRYNIKNPFEIKESLKKWEPIDLATLIPEERKEFAEEEAIDLLTNILRFDKQERLTAREAMEHPYFESVVKLIHNNSV